MTPSNRLVALVVLVLAKLAAGGTLTEPGLYVVDMHSAEVKYLGEYANPSIGGDERWLYADNGRGAIVRWPLSNLNANREVFATTPRGEPAYAYPLAAPTNDQVAVVQTERRGSLWRLRLSVLDAQGRRFRGPLALHETPHRNGAAAVSWDPLGQWLAFSLTLGNDEPGVKVFDPQTRVWHTIMPFGPRRAAPYPTVAWLPDGRGLTLADGETLTLRAGAFYEPVYTVPCRHLGQVWLDLSRLLVTDPDRGLVQYNAGLEEVAAHAGWRSPRPGAASLPAAGPDGLTWVGPAPSLAGDLALYWQRELGRPAREVVYFAAGREPYAQSTAGPIWLGRRPMAVVAVP